METSRNDNLRKWAINYLDSILIQAGQIKSKLNDPAYVRSDEFLFDLQQELRRADDSIDDLLDMVENQ